MATLASLERAEEAVQVGRLVDLELARLTAWRLGQARPDQTAPSPVSQAEQAARDAQAAAMFASWRA